MFAFCSRVFSSIHIFSSVSNSLSLEFNGRPSMSIPSFSPLLEPPLSVTCSLPLIRRIFSSLCPFFFFFLKPIFFFFSPCQAFLHNYPFNSAHPFFSLRIPSFFLPFFFFPSHLCRICRCSFLICSSVLLLMSNIFPVGHHPLSPSPFLFSPRDPLLVPLIFC